MNDQISNTLGLQPLPTSVPEVVEIKQVDSDFEFARNNMIEVIEKSKDALDGILDVAQMSQHPRGYEVAATLIKTIADINKDLLELSKKKKELSGNVETPKTVNNNLFVGSTSELLKMLKNKDLNE